MIKSDLKYMYARNGQVAGGRELLSRKYYEIERQINQTAFRVVGFCYCCFVLFGLVFVLKNSMSRFSDCLI